jgi:hypothetical protein
VKAAAREAAASTDDRNCLAGDSPPQKQVPPPIGRPSEINCAICGNPIVDLGPGGIPVDSAWVHWSRCAAEFERSRRPDPPSLPRERVLELFAQARAAGRLQP